MDGLQRNKTSAAQAMSIESGQINHMVSHPRPYTTKYKTLLAARRNLPVSSLRQEFLDMYHANQVIILSTSTGSGKTTQIPQFVLFDEWKSGLMVACTQPRRLAATSVAARVAEEMDVALGQEFGYSIRFEEKTSTKTRLKYCTDGKLVKEALRDQQLSRYSCIIIDESHERTIPTDILLAAAKRAIALRKDLKIIIMSATISAQKFLDYFKGAKLLLNNTIGSPYPVDTFWLNTPTSDICIACVKMVKAITTKPAGDILIFMQGERETQSLCAATRKELGTSTV